MQTVVKIKDWIKGFYGRFDVVIDIAVKFVIAFAALRLIGTRLGFLDVFHNPFVIILISLLCSILPAGLETAVLALCMLVNVYKASVEVALLLAVLLLITALLYYSFHPGDPLVLVLTPVLFAIGMPYVLPLIVGLTGSFISAVPMACGIVIFYLLGYIKTVPEFTGTDGMSLTEIPSRVKLVVDGAVKNKEMWVLIAVFVTALILVYLIRLLPFACSWYAAIGSGALIMAVMGAFADAQVSFIGIALSAVIAAVFAFFRHDVDFMRTERLQFEDDDYYYYVTAVPKLSEEMFGSSKKRDTDDD